MLQNGVAFECHPQNCVARFDMETKELKGFIVRDFGGLKIHQPTLKETTGVDLDFIEGHSIIAKTLDDVYTRMYHTIIHNHFQQLIRVLDLHYNGLGWNVVRRQLQQNIPREHPLYDAWLSPERTSLPGKCFMRMRMSSMYRFVRLAFASDSLASCSFFDKASPWTFPESHSLHRMRRRKQGVICSKICLEMRIL
jgi:siderophore synthetase component